MKDHVNVNADAFRIVAGFVSSEETRYYLKGVFVQPHPCGGVNLVATDGHRLFAYYDASGEASRAVIIPLSKPILKASKRTGQERKGTRLAGYRDALPGLRLKWNGERCTIETAAGEVRASEAMTSIDGTYPDWKRVIPRKIWREEGSAPATFNAGYVADFQGAARDLVESGLSDLSDNATGFIAIADSGEGGGAALVTINGDKNICALIMPARVDGTQTEPPAFVDARPYDSPKVQMTAPNPFCTYGSEKRIEIITEASPISGKKSRTYVFASYQQAVRAFNRVAAQIRARGGENAPEEIRPAYHFTNEEMRERTRRREAINAAAETFGNASEADLAEPWRVALLPSTISGVRHEGRGRGRRAVPVQIPAKREDVLRSLRHVSQAHALAAAYQAAA